MALFDLSYHWRFDRDTYRWECWLLRHPAPETLCMSRVGWITAEAAAVAQIDVKARVCRPIGSPTWRPPDVHRSLTLRRVLSVALRLQRCSAYFGGTAQRRSDRGHRVHLRSRLHRPLRAADLRVARLALPRPRGQDVSLRPPTRSTRRHVRRPWNQRPLTIRWFR